MSARGERRPADESDGAYDNCPYRKAKVEAWRALGIPIPYPKLTAEALDNLKRDLRDLFERFEDQPPA